MKQKQVKRICAMLMAGILAAGCLAGCGNNTDTTNTSSDAASTDAATSTDAAASTDAASTEEGPWKPENPGPVTIEVFTLLDSEAGEGVKGEDLYEWAYLENWFKEEGYDVTLNVTCASTWDECAQQMSLKCGTNQVPDLTEMRLEAKEQANYGMGEGLFMDWTPYINEKYMPNYVAQMEAVGNPDNPEVLPNGHYYELNTAGYRTLAIPDLYYVYVNKTMMNEAGYDELPTTTQDFFDMMYAMKATQDHPDGFWTWNFRSSMGANMFFWGPNQLWTYPNSTWGTRWFFNTEGTVVYGADTEVWDEMVSTYNQWMNDGIMHPDALTMDNTTKAAMAAEGQFGCYSCYHIADVIGSDPTQEQWENWLYAKPLTNSKTGQETIAHYNPNWGGTDMGWLVSADCEYKELIVYMIDYLCTKEATFDINYGPAAGEDPLGLVEGWTLDENGEFAPPAGYETWGKYRGAKLIGWGTGGMNVAEIDEYVSEITGVPVAECEEKLVVDAVTGKEYYVRDNTPGSYEDAEEKTLTKWVEEQQDCWRENQTFILQQDVYLDPDTLLRATELQQVIQEYVIAEGAKFTTGGRSLDELDDFHADLDAMGMEEFSQIYNEAYAPYLNSVFGE